MSVKKIILVTFLCFSLAHNNVYGGGNTGFSSGVVIVGVLVGAVCLVGSVYVVGALTVPITYPFPSLKVDLKGKEKDNLYDSKIDKSIAYAISTIYGTSKYGFIKKIEPDKLYINDDTAATMLSEIRGIRDLESVSGRNKSLRVKLRILGCTLGAIPVVIGLISSGTNHNSAASIAMVAGAGTILGTLILTIPRTEAENEFVKYHQLMTESTSNSNLEIQVNVGAINAGAIYTNGNVHYTSVVPGLNARISF